MRKRKTDGKNCCWSWFEDSAPPLCDPPIDSFVATGVELPEDRSRYGKEYRKKNDGLTLPLPLSLSSRAEGGKKVGEATVRIKVNNKGGWVYGRVSNTSGE
jgi:hypothetical protein